MKGPCQWCGFAYVVREYYDQWGNKLRDTDAHDCPAWTPQEPLDPTPTDTAFIRAERNTQEGLARYRQWLERQR